MPAEQHLFTYGTLLTGQRNAQLRAQPKVRPASIRGFCLYDLQPENYPALVASPNTKAEAVVWGECLSYSLRAWQQVLPLLDELEGLHDSPPLYSRQEVIIQLADGEQLTGQTYVYAQETRLTEAGAKLVQSGNWLAS